MGLVSLCVSSLALAGIVAAQNASLTQDNKISTDGLVSNSSRFNTILPVDNRTYGPPVEEVHYFYKYWPICIAVSSTTRIFVCYTQGDYEYTVAEVNSTTSEIPFPSAGLNLPSDRLNTTLDGIEFGSANSTGLISNLYRGPTANLLLQDRQSLLVEQAASNNVSWLGHRGGEANGFKGDGRGLIYMLMPTHNAVYCYDPADLQVHGFIRVPRIVWPDGATVAEDGYFYVIIN
ncbi:uncharacterized protein Z519_10404 [Cladophialophora bantiana CBS 173.52]|uniref:SMP-30/Gluconolactonase/LRE-like region domain-containing protein n=1 Tax=Cladophialophora bantiana (strain ATCC 10958 / CBS 173.52 / CDC B-1940 / NIH 8579) TaxID=1442370 RepID=A0A0D2HDF5_CLAB1|nr:uncharacterized protein Z519_10404 [Cladophialophora bantiana CBS 173.52]KIW88920.1 hypothetical protein Z519_10404 [Cladophialophora bantiana CBS 173.52]